MEALKLGFKVQVFATDIDCQAIAVARAGLYPGSIAADVSPERLARFFTQETPGGSYRIHKAIRDMMVFSEQNVIKDPPFSKLDLISCRNLLIYLGVDLQKNLMPLFHYALNPGGWLFLGTSETVGDGEYLFAARDRKAKLYQREHTYGNVPSSVVPALTVLQQTGLRTVSAAHSLKQLPQPPTQQPLRELAEQALLQQVVQSGALVNDQGDILYLHGRTGMYLELVAGESHINNIVKIAREGLKGDLTVALHKAVVTKGVVSRPGLSVKTNGHFTTVNLTIRPVLTVDPHLYLVVLEERPEEAPSAGSSLSSGGQPVSTGVPEDGAGGPSHSSGDSAHIAALQEELRAKSEYLQSTNEELETSNEELKSSNEEMQSVNEELQSTNEELETSKEELQSVNEELSTVNTELQNKMQDVSRANNDMNNLLAGTDIATIFVNHQLRILRFTPSATRIINLIQTDVGRPLSHIRDKLVDYARLEADMQVVLDTLIPREAEVRTTDGKWYAMHIVPYRTLDNVIEGAVLTFVDISEIVRARQALQESEEYFRSVLANMSDGVQLFDANGNMTYQNAASLRIHGFDRKADERIEGEVLKATWKAWDETGRPLATDEWPMSRIFRDGHIENQVLRVQRIGTDHGFWANSSGASVYDATGKFIFAYITIQDITARKQAEESLRKANEVLRLAVVVRDANDAITVQDMEGRIIAWNPGAVRMYGWSEAEALAMNVCDRIPQELRQDALKKLQQLGQAAVLSPYRTQRLAKNGKTLEVTMVSTALVNEAGKVYAIATTERVGGVL